VPSSAAPTPTPSSATPDPDGSAESGNGRPVTIANPLGNTVRVELDAAGLPIAITDLRGATTRYRRDVHGRVVEITDPVGGVTTLRWAPDGSLASRTTADGATEHWKRDLQGNLIEHADPSGRAMRLEYGPFDKPVAQILPDGRRLEFGYDAQMRLTTVTNPQGLVWRYVYDAAGRLVSETDFNGRVVRYAYDAAGQLVSRTNGAGQTITYVRDVLGRLVRIQSPEATTTFVYDRAGRLRQAVNPVADLRLERDALGRVTAEICNGRAVTSTYDAVGNRIRRTSPSGIDSVWDYDPAGSPLSLWVDGQTIAFEHDQAGREIRRRIGAGAVLDQQWDAAHRLISQALWGAPASPGAQPRLLQYRTYAYRPDGLPTGITDRLSGARRFDLDDNGRITGIRAQGWSEQYAYDAAGNITRASWPLPHDSAADPMADAVGDREYEGTLLRRAGRVRYEYDEQGRVVLRQHARLSSKPLTWRFQWNAEDRLTAVQTPDGIWWRYLYDPLGRRIAKQRLAPDGRSVVEQIDFFWDGPALVEQTHHTWSAERNAYISRTTSWDYEPGTLRPVAQIERTATRDAPQEWIDRRFHAIVTDLIGTPTELVDPAGSVTWHAQTTLWGAPRLSRSGGDGCLLRFPGQYHDTETGLNYNYHRYYDPGAARYESSDPIGLNGGPSHYGYVGNPLISYDPLGLTPKRLNLGSGRNPMEGAINVDPPYEHYPIYLDVLRVLKPDGTLWVTGSPKNKYAKPPANLSELGLEKIYDGPMKPEHKFGQQAYTNGKELPTTENHKTRIYRKTCTP